MNDDGAVIARRLAFLERELDRLGGTARHTCCSGTSPSSAAIKPPAHGAKPPLGLRGHMVRFFWKTLAPSNCHVKLWSLAGGQPAPDPSVLGQQTERACHARD